ADLAGGETPQAIDFDGDGTPDATLEISPDFPDYNQITRTSYDGVGRVSTQTRAAWPGQVDYYSPPESHAIYNLVTRFFYDDSGRQIAAVQNYKDVNGDGELTEADMLAEYGALNRI